MDFHATVEAVSPDRKDPNEPIYSHPEDTDVGDNDNYKHSSDYANVELHDTVLVFATNVSKMEAWTGPAKDLLPKYNQLQLSTQVFYRITIHNFDCRSGKLRLRCEISGTKGRGLVGWAPKEKDYAVPVGRKHTLAREAHYGLNWFAPIDIKRDGKAQLMCKVWCPE